MSYKQAKEDYEYLCSILEKGPHDFCGSFCNTESFFDLLNDPSKRKAEEIYSDLINYFFDAGEEFESCQKRVTLDLKDKKTNWIYKKYKVL